MEVFVLFDEEFGECQVFDDLPSAKGYFEKEDTGKWKRHKDDDSLWMSAKGFFYIFRREVLALANKEG